MRLRWQHSYPLAAVLPELTAGATILIGWATRKARGGYVQHKPLRFHSSPHGLIRCRHSALRHAFTGDETSFDPWHVVCQPQLPDCGKRYAVAIGLALGRGGSDDDEAVGTGV